MISLFDLTYFSIAICYLIIALFLQLLFATKNILVAGAILTHILLFLCSDLVCCLVFFYKSCLVLMLAHTKQTTGLQDFALVAFGLN
jgi:hypothetical protein